MLYFPFMAVLQGICRNRPALGCTIATGLSLLLIGCTLSPAERTSKADVHLQRMAAKLAKQTDAYSLAAAGLLISVLHLDQSLDLLTRATAAAPERPDLVWIQAQVCTRIAGCDPEPMGRRLRELDPANGAGWMGPLIRAHLSSNDEAMDAALAAIGQSDHFDIYWTTLIARLGRATAQVKTMSLEEGEVTIIGVLAAQAIPAYSVASNACKGEHLQRAETIEVCRGVARSFENGDTNITEMIGIAIAKRVWPEDSPEWRAAADARRLYEYRSQFWKDLDLWGSSHTEEYLTLCAENRREQDVLKAQLTAAGKNPNPPLE